MGKKGDVSSIEQILLKTFLDELKKICKHTEEFFNPSPKHIKEVKSFLKAFYVFILNEGEITKENADIVPTLSFKSLDTESVWQQINIKNEIELPIILKAASDALAIANESLKFKVLLPGDNDDNLSLNSNLSDENKDLQNELDNKKIQNKKAIRKKNKGIKSVVDDKFFKLSELDAFLKREEKIQMLKSSNKFNNEENINLFSEEFGIDDDHTIGEEVHMNYKDFFADSDNENEGVYEENEFENEAELEEAENEDETEEEEENYDSNQHSKKAGIEHEENNSSDSEDGEIELSLNKKNNESKTHVGGKSQSNSEDEDTLDKNSQLETKSSFEARQEKLNERITALEEKALGDKPWQLKGEIKAHNRPENSLLEEVLEYEAGVRPAPIVTEETNLKLEDIIRQRIKDQAWDDPVRIVKPQIGPEDFRKKLILDGEKSKKSLAEIYEKEYQKQVENLNVDNDMNENEEELKEHREIKSMMTILFTKLDALSNFHFTPKPIPAEVKIITNTPAINLEEVAPVAVSNAQLLAPEEIKTTAKGDVLGKSERTKSDKNRERRHKKQFQKRMFKVKEERETQKLKAGIPLSTKEDKDKALRNVIKHRNVSKMSESSDKAIKSSKLFFDQLQGNLNTGVKVKRKPNKFSDSSLSAKKLKL